MDTIPRAKCLEVAMAANARLLEEWKLRIEEYRASGLSAREWCERNGVSQHKLRYWIERSREYPEKIDWTQMEIADSDTGEGGVSIRIGAAYIEVEEGFNHTLLYDVLHVVVSAIC
jgi:hypothetical protein